MGLSDANNCASKVQIDNLLYTLIPGTPRLQKVADSAPTAYRAKGFNPGASPGSDYVYDQNGNLITDPYKGLTIQYNFLNLPKQITKGGSSITIRYDVTGRKWSQTGPEGIREYVGAINYLSQLLQSVQHGEGRLVPTYNGTAIESIRAEYWRQDHLGNTRIAFSDFNLDGVIATQDDPNTLENDVELTQENHYYPFGLNQEGPWYQTVAPKNKYQYNRKEYVENLGLNWNDYGARWYDPAIGRWIAIDPSAQKYLSSSPFQYTLNNPLRFFDPDGMDPGDVIVLFTVADVFSQGGLGSTQPIINALMNQFINSRGGAIKGFTSKYWDFKTYPGQHGEPHKKLQNTFNALDAATQEAYDYIVQNYAEDGKIILYGYSYGGVLASHLEKRLAKAGIKVNLLVTVDAAAGPQTNKVDRRISDNTEENLNIYQTNVSPIGSHGAKNTREDNSSSGITNIIKVNYVDEKGKQRTISHGVIDEVSAQEVIAKILAELIKKND